VTHYLASDGSRLCFARSGTGPPLVMVHGFASSGKVFQKQLSTLDEFFTVYRPDLRGHGRSANVTIGARVTRLARDLHDLMKSEQLENVRLVGWSMGCTVIWSYLDIYGDSNVNSYAFLEEIPYVLESAETVGSRVGKIDCSTLINLYDRFSDSTKRTREMTSFIDSMLHCTESERAEILSDVETADSALSTGLLLNSIATDYRELISRLTRPSLFISGDCSFFKSVFSNWMYETAPNSTLVVLENAGHFLTIENSKEVNTALIKFFR